MLIKSHSTLVLGLALSLLAILSTQNSRAAEANCAEVMANDGSQPVQKITNQFLNQFLTDVATKPVVVSPRKMKKQGFDFNKFEVDIVHGNNRVAAAQLKFNRIGKIIRSPNKLSKHPEFYELVLTYLTSSGNPLNPVSLTYDRRRRNAKEDATEQTLRFTGEIEIDGTTKTLVANVHQSREFWPGSGIWKVSDIVLSVISPKEDAALVEPPAFTDQEATAILRANVEDGFLRGGLVRAAALFPAFDAETLELFNQEFGFRDFADVPPKAISQSNINSLYSDQLTMRIKDTNAYTVIPNLFKPLMDSTSSTAFMNAVDFMSKHAALPVFAKSAPHMKQCLDVLGSRAKLEEILKSGVLNPLERNWLLTLTRNFHPNLGN